MIDILEDVSNLTTIPKNSLDNLSKRYIWCIADSFKEMILSKEDEIKLDIGIGVLYIRVIDDEIKYKFLPSNCLEKTLISVATDKVNPLEVTLEKKLVSTILNTYKDIV